MEWVADHSADLDADPGMLIVAGQGAGGGLAAAVALHVRDHGWPTLAHQILAFPRLSPPLADDGIQETGSALPRPSVMRSLAGVAPATVLTSVAGSLCRDDGRSYAARLRRDGVQVTELRYSGRFHGCPCHGDGAICDGLPRAPPPWSLRPCPATSSRFRGAGSSA
jgi:acetyl esterase